MRASLCFALLISAGSASACDTAVCVVDPQSLGLTRIITFDDTQSSAGPGHQIIDLLVLDGAVFGERFAGQSVSSAGDHDVVVGSALRPLTVMPGDQGQNLSVVFFNGNNVLNGYGMAGYPRRNAQGEGAIAFLFDEDQSALSFQLRGGEAGTAHVRFLARDGTVLSSLDLPPAHEHAYGFLRANGANDIAGVVLTNTDPQGLAIDNIRFERAREVS